MINGLAMARLTSLLTQHKRVVAAKDGTVDPTSFGFEAVKGPASLGSRFDWHCYLVSSLGSLHSFRLERRFYLLQIKLPDHELAWAAVRNAASPEWYPKAGFP